MANFCKFKLPQLPRRSTETVNIPQFDFNKLVVKERIGQGSFGDVFTATFKTPGCEETETVVVKKMINVLDQEERKLFTKEVAILHGLNHSNVVKFKAVCYKPQAMMLEYVYFDFKPFGQDIRVSALSDFLLEIDDANCEGFHDLVHHAAKEIIQGLAYLHSNGIAHRDLKSSNILVSNQHYSSLCAEDREFELMYQSRPVECKLTDFGESRSLLIQTKTVLASKTNSVDRGTVVYMAPELLLKERALSNASIDDLKLADIWAVGMIFFTMVNPNLKCPYILEIRSQGGIRSQEELKSFITSLMRSERYPMQDAKYEIARATVWRELENVFRGCVKWKREERFSLDEACAILKRDGDQHLRTNIDSIQLKVSQASAVEQFDEELVSQFEERGSNDIVQMNSTPSNDGTNACAFLSVAVADIIFKLDKGDAFFTRLAESVEQTIWFLPEKINAHRDLAKNYDAMEAYRILRNLHIVSSSYELYEELPFADGVYSPVGREKLHSKLCCLSCNDFVAFFTCDPLVLTVGCVNRRSFLIDTHPVSLSPGRGTGLILVGKGNSPEVWMSLCTWIWQRLRHCGVKQTRGQSLVLLAPETK